MRERLHHPGGVKVAVIGMGYWGKNLVRNFHELGALSTICDSDTNVAATHGAKYPDVRFCTEYRAVLADPTLSAVALATPAVAHYRMAKEALNAGKDVFVEKPLAVDVAEGEELQRVARANDRLLMVGHILQYHPAVRKLRELVTAGALGKLHYLYSNRLNIGKIRAEENILWSFAPHDISVILSLLGETPTSVTSHGEAFLNPSVYDVTMSQLHFGSGVRAHIFVSWLHPVKEQRLVVVGSEKMAVFDDTAEDKLVLYPHKVEWKQRVPTAVKAQGEKVSLEALEPLREECLHFLDCVAEGKQPVTDGQEGLRVLQVLDACQRSLREGGHLVSLTDVSKAASHPNYFAHSTATIDPGAEIGAGAKIWHHAHVMKGALIGEQCVLGQNVNIASGVVIGRNVKIQNNVSVYTGTIIEDDVFLGPSCVLTNVSNPRSQINRHALYESTVLKRGCTIGANATVICGITIGRYAFIAAGAVVTKDVPDYALIVGNPGRRVGWMSRHGHRLHPDADGNMRCPEIGYRYREVEAGVVRCLDLGENEPLPAALCNGMHSYREFKRPPNGALRRVANDLVHECPEAQPERVAP